jgi:O-succinylbenzoic acid--CoA ligase
MPFLAAALTRNPSGLAVDDGEENWTFRELAEEVRVMSSRLRALGVGPGTVVALDGRWDRHHLVALHGIWRAGAVAAPLHERWTGPERDAGLGLLDPDLVLIGEDGPEEGARISLPDGLLALGLGPQRRASLPSISGIEPSTESVPVPSLQREVAVVLTSGTSGSSGKVPVTLGNLLSSARGAQERLELNPDDRWLGSLSLSHIGGLALASRAALVGSSLILRGSFRAEEFLSLMETGSITHASLVPTMLYKALELWGEREVPASLRCLLLGGAPAGTDLIQAALDVGFPLAVTYGLTEASSQVATAPPGLVRQKPGTVGPPLPGVEVLVGDGGELLVRGPTVAPGQAGSDGWLHTGDLARVDGDGHLWITGRISDRVISGGVNVDPREIQLVLEAHPKVDEAVVVGIPDPEWGERVVAAVACKSPTPSLERELDGLVRANLSAAKRPRSLRMLRSLPLNPNGKVDRERVKGLFL